MFLLGNNIPREEFFARYWRQRPLLLKGVGGPLPTPWTAEAFHAAAQRLEEHEPTLVSRKQTDVVFAQQLNRTDAALDALVREIACDVPCPSIHVDGVSAKSGHGIGCHYDDSDNFVFQQAGTKIWRLHPPSIIPTEELRARMLKNPSVGNMYMPDQYLEFTLEPGDMLYLPLFWPHWGISQGWSLSLSIVCNSDNLLHELRGVMMDVLSRYEAWWKAVPLETPYRTTHTAKAIEDPQIDRHFDEAFQILRSEAFHHEVHLTWRRQRCQRLTEFLRPPVQRALASAPADPLPLDMAYIRAILQEPLPALDLSSIVFPEQTEGLNRLLRRYAAKPYIKRFFLACGKASQLLEDDPLRHSTRNVVAALQRLPSEALAELVLRPEVMSWIMSAIKAFEGTYRPRVTAVLHHLGSLVVPTLLQHAALRENDAVHIMRSSPHVWHLLPLKVALVSTAELPQDFLIVCKGDRLQFTHRNTPFLELDTQGLCAERMREVHRDAGFTFQPLPGTRDGAIVVLRRHAWFEEFFPKDGMERSSPLYLEINDEDFHTFIDRMSQGCALVNTYWPEAWHEFQENISLLMPLANEAGLHPHNASVHAFRGLITSSSRPSYLAAQTLVHEMSHNKFSSVADVFRLFENTGEELYYSPFVHTDRPMMALFHGVFAFLNDLMITLRMMGHVEEIGALSMARYARKLLQRLRTALDTIQHSARLTKDGVRLVHGLEQAYERSLDLSQKYL